MQENSYIVNVEVTNRQNERDEQIRKVKAPNAKEAHKKVLFSEDFDMYNGDEILSIYNEATLECVFRINKGFQVE